MACEIPEALVQQLRQAERVAVLTGAGVSAESNIPTFRDAQTGLWARYRPEELATPEAFLQDPKLVWEWYAWRRDMISGAVPNPGHQALATMERLIPQFLLITQNVDGLHPLAGSQAMVELHGNIRRTKCFDCHQPADSWSADPVPPLCSRCGGKLRPDVVWFGEALPSDALERAMAASQTCDIFFSVGTSALVYPAAGLIYEAMRRGAVTVEVNPRPTAQAGEVTYSLTGPGGEILPALITAAWPDHETSAPKP